MLSCNSPMLYRPSLASRADRDRFRVVRPIFLAVSVFKNRQLVVIKLFKIIGALLIKVNNTEVFNVNGGLCLHIIFFSFLDFEEKVDRVFQLKNAWAIDLLKHIVLEQIDYVGFLIGLKDVVALGFYFELVAFVRCKKALKWLETIFKNTEAALKLFFL